MNYEVNNINGITIFKLNEKKLDTNISGLVKGELILLLKVEGINKLVLDLSEVEACDSSGLSAIIVANRILNSNNGEFLLAAPTDKVLALIRVTQLDRVLKICKTVEEALSVLNKK